MKVQSQQPTAPAGPAPAAEAPQETPSTSFSEVMARKNQPEGQTEPGMDQPSAGEPPPAPPPGGEQMPGGETPAVPYAASPGAAPRALAPETPGLPAETPFPRAASNPLGGGAALAEQPFPEQPVLPGEETSFPEFPAHPEMERLPPGELAFPIPGQTAPVEREKLPFPLTPGGGEPTVRFEVPGETQKPPLEPGQMPQEGAPPDLGPAKPGKPQETPRFGGIEARDSRNESGEVASEDLDLDLDELAEDQPATPGAPAPVFQLKTEAPAPAKPVEAPRPLQDLQKIRALVQEVRLASSPSGDKMQMDITLNSQTLDGLQIRIERNEGRMNIQFATRNDDVAQLLTRNLQNLQQSLAAHGLRVANLHVVNPMAQAQAAPQPFAIRTGDAARSESGRQDSSDREGRRGGQGQGQGQGQDGRRRGRQ
jgi:hypothetical protein